DDSTLRVAYKLMWNSLVQHERPMKELLPALDEQRLLYRFYFEHPRAREGDVLAIEAARAAAKTDRECDLLVARRRAAAETWRLERIRRYGEVDPEYPLLFAIGVAQYRRAQFGPSAQAFREWLKAHPDGPLALRAKHH